MVMLLEKDEATQKDKIMRFGSWRQDELAK
jgi:hypothetical protein